MENLVGYEGSSSEEEETPDVDSASEPKPTPEVRLPSEQPSTPSEAVEIMEVETNEELRPPPEARQFSTLPPTPPGEPADDVQKKFFGLFQYKEKNNLDMNRQILNRKEFKNPAIYDKLKEDYGVNEYGTNYVINEQSAILLDPSDYYDKLETIGLPTTSK